MLIVLIRKDMTMEDIAVWIEPGIPGEIEALFRRGDIESITHQAAQQLPQESQILGICLMNRFYLPCDAKLGDWILEASPTVCSCGVDNKVYPIILIVPKDIKTRKATFTLPLAIWCPFCKEVTPLDISKAFRKK